MYLHFFALLTDRLVRDTGAAPSESGGFVRAECTKCVA
jgi:hypothetical protein